MADRYITEKEAIECIKFGLQFGFTPIQCIEHTPTADVPALMRGSWSGCALNWACSACNCHSRYTSNFCPNCGADMREECK